MKTWLISGGCGFIGVNLVKALLGQAVGIRVFDNMSVGSPDDLATVAEHCRVDKPGKPQAGQVELIEGDIRDKDAIRVAARGADVVVHLAAATGVIPSIEDPLFDCQQNVVGTLNTLEAAKQAGVQAFVMASSGAPLGEQDPPLDEQKVPRPISPYGASKLAGEAYCSAYHGSFGLATVALRFSNVYGPYSVKKGSVVAKFIRRILAGEPLVIYGDGDGEQTRDYIHARDLCKAIIRAGQGDVGGEVFQVATGRETSVNQLVEKLGRLVERDLGQELKPIHEPERPGEVSRNYADISKARRVLSFDPQVDLDAGLEETWAWFIEHRDR